MNETKIFLNTWGAYSCGSLGFGWFTPEEAREFMEQALEDENFIEKNGEEFFIADIDNYLGVDFGNLDYADIEAVCDTIEELEALDNDEQEKVVAIINNFNIELEEAIKYSDDYDLFDSESDFDNYIDEMVDDCYLFNAPDTLRYYFDYKAFRRDYKIECSYVVLDNHKVIVVR